MGTWRAPIQWLATRACLQQLRVFAVSWTGNLDLCLFSRACLGTRATWVFRDSTFSGRFLRPILYQCRQLPSDDAFLRIRYDCKVCNDGSRPHEASTMCLGRSVLTLFSTPFCLGPRNVHIREKSPTTAKVAVQSPKQQGKAQSLCSAQRGEEAALSKSKTNSPARAYSLGLPK